MDPSLQDVLDQRTYKWMFVGGKGGVGKTTTSSSLSVLLAESRPAEKFLLISTDPAHNLSDAFDQKFGKEPIKVNGVPNLYAVEVDAADEMSTAAESLNKGLKKTEGGNEGDDDSTNLFSSMNDMVKLFSSFFKDGSLPGMDEFVSFTKVVSLVESDEFSTVIFDTAPTGHTLRFLGLPETVQQIMELIIKLRNNMGGMLSMVTQMMGMSQDDVFGILDKMGPKLDAVKKVTAEFKDPSLCTFIGVCIPEFLSLYETERLIQQLAVLDMDCRAIVINFILDADESSSCFMCRSRARMQNKYIKQIRELYEDFNIVFSPLRPDEVRGIDNLRSYSESLVKPYSFCWNK